MLLKRKIIFRYNIMPKTVTMTKADLLAEHKKLIKVLRTGTKIEQMREAASQAKEMLKYKK